MRAWAEIFTLRGSFLGTVYNLITVAKGRMLDAGGTISVSFSGADADAVSLLVEERRIDIYVEDNGKERLYGRGVIRDVNISVAANSITFTTSGKDALDALTRKSVLLGRMYEAQSVYSIINDLLSLVDGNWYASVDTGLGLQSARFDGVNVLKALIRVAQELGLHLREGMEVNEVEIGAFGTSCGVRALAPGTITQQVMDNDDIVIIDKIQPKKSSRNVVNWIIPIGAGEGTAALTLEHSTRTLGGGYPYEIRSLTGPDGRTLYYLADDDSIEDYDGEIQRTVVFKEIGPVANSETAKQLAANALYDAAAAWLRRNAVAQRTYSMTVRKVRKTIRPGDTIPVMYKGQVETEQGMFAPVDVNDVFWILKTTETLSESGCTVSMDISTVDQHEQDLNQQIVGAIEAINVKNIAVQTFPFWSENTYTDSIEVYFPGTSGKPANFKLEIDEAVTDLIRVQIRFKTRPLFVYDQFTAQFGSAGTNIDRVFHILSSDQYPKKVQLFIDGVNYTTQFGGIWNPNALDNNALDVTCDITNIIRDSPNMYGDHTIVLTCGTGSVDNPVPGYAHTSLHGESSSGIVEMNIRILGTAQTIKP